MPKSNNSKEIKVFDSLTGPVEAYYFAYLRSFMKTTVSHIIMERNQDLIELEYIKSVKVKKLSNIK